MSICPAHTDFRVWLQRSSVEIADSNVMAVMSVDFIRGVTFGAEQLGTGVVGSYVRVSVCDRLSR